MLQRISIRMKVNNTRQIKRLRVINRLQMTRTIVLISAELILKKFKLQNHLRSYNQHNKCLNHLTVAYREHHLEKWKKNPSKQPVLTIRFYKNKSRRLKKSTMKQKHQKTHLCIEREVIGIHQPKRNHEKKFQHLIKSKINHSIKAKKSFMTAKQKIKILEANQDQIRFHQFEVNQNLQVRNS